MDNIIVLNQNVKLQSLSRLTEMVAPGSETMILSSQFIFENEAEIIDSILSTKCIYKNFSDILTDAECQKCDEDAFELMKNGQEVSRYYEQIQTIKNERLISKLLKLYNFKKKIVTDDGLGIRIEEWKKQGFEFINLDYYYIKPTSHTRKSSNSLIIIQKSFRAFLKIKRIFTDPIYEAFKDGTRYLFYGRLTRIAYRINLEFHKASFWEHVFYMFNTLGIVWKNDTIRLSSFHEGYRTIPDNKKLNVKLIQDGYLPPNYSSNYLYFYGQNIEFYTWDDISCNTFRYHHLPYKIMPFRKKLFLPEFTFPITEVKKVLCASSGTGDWTAIKNRSDDDRLVWAMGKVAAMFPHVEFIYRCHPTWIHPSHAGVNSINRCIEYISWLNLPNFKMSSNIPAAIQDGKFVLSYKRSSFEEDLKGVDLVFGEHSVAMLDAGFMGIPFASCNLTGHRAFYEDINKLGFPHCETVEEMASLITNLSSDRVKKQYLEAISNYNEMTDKE